MNYDGVHCDIVKIKTALDERNYTTSFRMKRLKAIELFYGKEEYLK